MASVHMARQAGKEGRGTLAKKHINRENESDMLYHVETITFRHVTYVTADNSQEAHRKAWHLISRKAPELVPFLRREGIVVYPARGGMWGKSEGV